MTIPLGAGALVLDVSTLRGAVCAVEIGSSRSTGMARLFNGRPVAEVPDLARQVFSLCGHAQASAARLALWASGSLPEPEPVLMEIGLCAEQVFETLRSLTLSWPSFRSGDIRLGDAALILRRAVAASQALLAASQSQVADLASLQVHAATLRDCACGLGLGKRGGESAAGSLLGQIEFETRSERAFLPRAVDPLTAADDNDVLSALMADPDGFSARPGLAGRIPETGSHARWFRACDPGLGSLGQRFAARLIDLHDCLDRLDRALTGKVEAPATVAVATGKRSGAGIVECARGRLYHHVEVEPQGTVLRAAILAPTEWNFQPGGPLAVTLLGASIGTGEAARASVMRLAALFDPCVAFDVQIAEAGHA